MKKYFPIVFLVVALSACDKDKKSDDEVDTTNTIENTLGFGLLSKVKGIWNGPVSSTTGLGSYPEWIVDFRPISENQISAKNELDSLNDIHMSFFIAKYNNQYKLCFRNGGSFAGMTRVSYFLADSVSETSAQSYYRFAELIKGKNRAYTEVIFKQDSLIMKSYTNKSNSLTNPTLHMSWSAKLQDTTSCQAAVAHFSFPKKTLTKDFSSTFNGIQETIYYSTTGGDPYPESDQPYLGQATITYSFASTFTPNPSDKIFLVISTQPLISLSPPFLVNPNTRSRYVILPASDNNFIFNYMHPGAYYLYALYDKDGNNTFNSGDGVSINNTTFTLLETGTVNSSTQINFTIP